MRDPSKNVDVDVVKEGGGVMNKETTNYFYPLTGEVGVGKKDLEEVIVVDGVEGFADIEKGLSRRLLSFRVTIVGKQAEGPQLVFHLDANICPGAIIH